MADQEAANRAMKRRVAPGSGSGDMAVAPEDVQLREKTNDVVHIYKYYSSDPKLEGPPACLYLHKKVKSRDEFTHSCEFVSRWTGMTDLHGHWTLLDDDSRLVLDFNCREGTVPCSGDRARPLHRTTMFRVETVLGNGDLASWVGDDDKGWEIHLVHSRSLVKIEQVGKPSRMVIVDTPL